MDNLYANQGQTKLNLSVVLVVKEKTWWLAELSNSVHLCNLFIVITASLASS